MLKRLLQKVIKQHDGISALIFALCLPFIVGFMALAIDWTYAYYVKAKLQSSASSAALAGASQLDPDLDVLTMRTLALAEAELYADTKNPGLGHDDNVLHMGNPALMADGDIIIGHWDDDRDPEFLPENDSNFDEDTMRRNAVKVTTRRSVDHQEASNPLPLFIGTFLPQANVNTSAVATAFGGVTEEVCLLALQPNDPGALYFNGNITVQSPACGVCSVGGIDAQGIPIIDVGGDDSAIIYRNDGPGLDDKGNVQWNPYPLPGPECLDPYKDSGYFSDHWDDVCPDDQLADPVDIVVVCEGCDGGADEVHVVMKPGTVCGPVEIEGKNVTINGSTDWIDKDTQTVTGLELAPGVHHVVAYGSGKQEFKVTGASDIPITGENTTVLTSGVDIKWEGNSNIDISAPTSIYDGNGNLWPGYTDTDSPGFAFYQNPTNPGPDDSPLTHDIGGNDVTNVNGTMYFGLYSEVKLHGTVQASDDPNGCLALIGGVFEFKGTVDLNLDANCAQDLPLGEVDLIVRLQD